MSKSLPNQHVFKAITGALMDYVLLQHSSNRRKQRVFWAMQTVETVPEFYLQSGRCDLRNTFRVSTWVQVKFIAYYKTDVGVMPETSSSIQPKREMLVDWAKSTLILQRWQDLGWRRLLILDRPVHSHSPTASDKRADPLSFLVLHKETRPHHDGQVSTPSLCRLCLSPSQRAGLNPHVQIPSIAI